MVPALRPSALAHTVAFTVDDARAIYEKAVSRGAKSIREPWEEKDEHGTVIMATVATVRADKHGNLGSVPHGR